MLIKQFLKSKKQKNCLETHKTVFVREPVICIHHWDPQILFGRCHGSLFSLSILLIGIERGTKPIQQQNYIRYHRVFNIF